MLDSSVFSFLLFPFLSPRFLISGDSFLLVSFSLHSFISCFACLQTHSADFLSWFYVYIAPLFSVSLLNSCWDFFLLYSLYYLTCLLQLFSQFIFSKVVQSYIVLFPCSNKAVVQQWDPRYELHIDCSNGGNKIAWIFTCIHRCDYSSVFVFSLLVDSRSSIIAQPASSWLHCRNWSPVAMGSHMLSSTERNKISLSYFC